MGKKADKETKKDNKYNVDNEIIIGVTTKPKEKVRVEKKKTTRTNNKIKSNKEKDIISKNNKKIQSKGIKVNKNIKIKTNNKDLTKNDKIIKSNIKKITLSIGVLLIIAICGTIYYLTTPVFNISNIEVYGNKKNSIDTYISLSKINIETTNIFAFSKNKIKENIKQNSYVEDVIIKRKLPNTLEINVKEREVYYQVKYLNKYIYLDKQGYILEISEEKKSVPVINGFITVKQSINIGERLIEEDLIKLNVVAKIINYCKYNTIENKIASIDVTKDTDYIVYFKEDKKTLYLGEATNLSERLSMLKNILENEKNKEIEIFMNGDLNKDKVYIRYVEE